MLLVYQYSVLQARRELLSRRGGPFCQGVGELLFILFYSESEMISCCAESVTLLPSRATIVAR